MYQYSWKGYTLEPDALFWLDGPEIHTALAFLEVDRTTESLAQWQGKLESYRQYVFAPEGLVVQHGPLPPQVLLLVTTLSRPRADNLRRCTAEAWGRSRVKDVLRVGFAMHEQVCVEGILGMPWVGLNGRPFRLNDRIP